MAVPNTNTFSLQDVVDEISGTQTSLQDCVDDATASGLDPNYGSVPITNMLEFRNYVDFVCGDYTNNLPLSLTSTQWVFEAGWMSFGRYLGVVIRDTANTLVDTIKVLKSNTNFCVNGLTLYVNTSHTHSSNVDDRYYAFNHEDVTFMRVTTYTSGSPTATGYHVNTTNQTISAASINSNFATPLSFINSAGSDFLGLVPIIGADTTVTGVGILEKQYTSVSGVYRHRLRIYETSNQGDWSSTSATWSFEMDIIMNSDRGAGNPTPVTRVYSLGCAINNSETTQTIWFATDETSTGVWKHGWNISWDHILGTNVSSNEDSALEFGIDFDTITLGADQILVGDYHAGVGASEQRATVIDYSTTSAVEMETDNTTSDLLG